MLTLHAEATGKAAQVNGTVRSPNRNESALAPRLRIGRRRGVNAANLSVLLRAVLAAVVVGIADGERHGDGRANQAGQDKRGDHESARAVLPPQRNASGDEHRSAP